jgi:ABC-2 type transport system ATP-binding protein
VNNTILSVSQLTKRFGESEVLSEVTFTIREQEIVGLIGPNGAGKTTLLECIAGFLPFDSGSVDAEDFFYLAEELNPYPEQWVGDVLWFFATTNQTSSGRLNELIDELDLKDSLNKRVGALSKGYRRRLLLTIALLSSSRLLILDEPFDGLDLRQTIKVISLLQQERQAGRALLLSIHQLSDAEDVGDRFLLLSSGVLIGEGNMTTLQERTGAQSLKEVFLALT